MANFLPPDMEWLEEYETLRRTGSLAADSELPRRLRKRLTWEIWSEYTHNARIGRSLEKTGSSVVEPAPEKFHAAAEVVMLRLQNEIGGLRDVEPAAVRAFLAGFLINLKNRGGVWHDELQQYVTDLGNSYALTKVGERQLYMPRYSPWSRLPEFLIPWAAGRSRFLVLVSGSTSAPSWHTEWLQRSFGRFDPNIGSLTEASYRAVLKELVSRRLLFEVNAGKVPVWGIAHECLQVTEDVRQLRCDRCSFLMSAGPETAAVLSGTRCPHITCRRGILREQPKTEDYYGRLYRAGEVARIFATEHTGLLTREVREAVEAGFEKREKPGDPNLLSCTPTLEFSRGEEGLRYRLVERLRRRAEELKKWRARIQILNKRIRELQDTPMLEDERRKEEDELRQEKSALHHVAVPQADLADRSFRGLRAWLRLLDDRAAGASADWRRAWREFLRLNNAIQFLPEAAWMTSTGLEEGLTAACWSMDPPKRLSGRMLHSSCSSPTCSTTMRAGS